MRDLTASKLIAEVIEGEDKHEIHFRRPTTQERAEYAAGAFVRQGNQIVNNTFAMRVKLGSSLLLGFTKGTLGADGKLISSDHGDPDYRDDWRDILVNGAPEIVAAVAQAAFENVTLVGSGSKSGSTEGVVEDLGEAPLADA